MKVYALVSSDLGFVFVGILLLALVVVTPMVYQQSLLQMQQSKSTAKIDPTAPNIRESALIEIVPVKNGMAYYLTQQGGKRQAMSSSKALIAMLERTRPQVVRFRRDRRATVGAEDDILLGLDNLKLQWWFEYKR